MVSTGGAGGGATEAPPQSHAPKRAPSAPQVCAPLHAPGPRDAWVEPGKHPRGAVACEATGAAGGFVPSAMRAPEDRQRMTASLVVMTLFTGSTPLRATTSFACTTS